MENKALSFFILLLLVTPCLATNLDVSIGDSGTMYILSGNDIHKDKMSGKAINSAVSHSRVDLNKKRISRWRIDGAFTMTEELSNAETKRLTEYLRVPMDYKEIADKIVFPTEIEKVNQAIYSLCKDNSYIPGIVALIDPQDGHTIKVYKLGSEKERKKMCLTGIAVNNDGEIYVADYANSLVYHLNNKGEIVSKWGGRGSGNGQFKQVWGIAVDPRTNDVYVSDIFPGSERRLWEYPQRRIQVFDRNGKFKRKWGGNEILGVNWWPLRWNVRSRLGDVVDLVINQQGEVYLLEKNLNKVSKYTSDGKFLLEWGSYGSANGLFNSPEGICFDRSGNLYVADTGNNRIQKFDSNGKFLMEIR